MGSPLGPVSGHEADDEVEGPQPGIPQQRATSSFAEVRLVTKFASSQVAEQPVRQQAHVEDAEPARKLRRPAALAVIIPCNVAPHKAHRSL